MEILKTEEFLAWASSLKDRRALAYVNETAGRTDKEIMTWQ